MEGSAIRHRYYHNGTIIRREFHDRNGNHVSTEYFDHDGWITENIRWIIEDCERKLYSHWLFDHGLPIKLIGSEGHNPTTITPGIKRLPQKSG